MAEAFDSVSSQYQNKALVQQKAAQKLIELLEISGNVSVLDVGCGPGHITNAIAELTAGKVIGTDISGGMIEQAKKNYPKLEFFRSSAEELSFQNEFEVVFCNSTFQWFQKPELAVKKMTQALQPGGRMGIACPGTDKWSPWFLKLIPKVLINPEIKKTFQHWRNPWTFLPDQAAYQKLFENSGLKTKYISVDFESKKYTVEQAYNIYISGAANGFLGKEFYDISITEDYINKFNGYFKAEIEKNSKDGMIDVDFNRFYYVGIK